MKGAIALKIQITATENITDINGVPVRLWEGVTERGIKCKVFVHRIAVHPDEDAGPFDEELREMAPPTVKVDLRHLF